MGLGADVVGSSPAARQLFFVYFPLTHSVSLECRLYVIYISVASQLVYICFFLEHSGWVENKYFENRKKKERDDWREEKMTTATLSSFYFQNIYSALTQSVLSKK